ncbi:MAG TPA: serine/threonine-protein kinase, partial [Kofleriaceae bacterium]|nr:serine/threonine-protein kinase [Kofleriaceae bacterium]
RLEKIGYDLGVIAVGATVGNYRVMEKIGQGAMGSVFLATHPVIGKRVALKVIHPELSSNEEMIARFFNEARAVTQIGHENIVDVQDFGQTPDGDSFIVMELLEGFGLGERMKAHGAFSVPRATHIALQIADGLAAAHARGIIHRDLKPDNVMLVPRGGDPDFVKILDFGLAKLSGPGAMNHHTKTGSLLGTPHYMAPEQAEGSKKVDQRVDVYALGCMLFEMLTGRVPFPGEGFGEVLVKHVREPPPLPSRLNSEVPKAIEKIVLHALAKKPEFRFKSMDDFRSALRDPERFAHSLDSSDALRLTPGEPMPAPVLVPAAQSMIPMAPPAAPLRLPEDAATVQGQAPPEVQAAIDRAARARAAAPPVRAAAYAPASHAAPTGPGQHGGRSTVAQPAARRRSTPKRSRSPAIVLGIFAGLVLFAAIGTIGYYVLGSTGSVTITVATVPPGAEVFNGDKKLGVSPVVIALPKGGGPVSLSFRKDGYLSSQRSLTPNADQEVQLRLLPRPTSDEPAPPEPPAAVPKPPVPVVAAPPAPPPTPTKVSPPAKKPPPEVAEVTSPPPPPEKKSRPHKPREKKNPDTLLLTPSF